MSHLHLTELHRLYQLETQPFRKVHRMIDLFESLIKSHTVVIIAEYVKHNKLSDAAKGMLAQGLRTPSLGTWQLFSRILSEELNADGYAWTFPGFAEAFSALDKALNTAKTNVIAFRNGYAHGATPSDAQCESDILQFEPFMLQLLQSRWLADTSLEYRDEKVWMASATGALCLHPIFLYKEEGGSSPYAFFNDLKNDKVGLLNYPLSKHYREKDFYREFHEYLPLQEWKKSGNNEFQQRIEELTETFKGRIGEREKLLDFVRNNSKGYMSIQGNPGIGKSALIAQFFKDLNAHQATHHLQVVEYFIRRGTAQAQVEYLFNHLIRRTDELFAQGREIRAEGKAVWDLQQQLFSKWRLWNNHCEGRKLLFLIDGLDEGVENNVVTYMPRENFENILIIYGSRPGGHKSIDELWSQLPVEHHTKLELSGLGKADIRALIYEVANKYEIERESAWIDAVQQRSQGNPLYLKLLCDAMENGSIALNDIHALPKEIDDYYKAILDRYAHDADGDALLAGLFAFAAARDYLTMNHLGLINGIGDATVQRIGSTLKEVLYENPLTEEVLDYQLFHESFRKYLMKEKGSRVTEAAERIIDFCAGWKALEGTWEQRYALEHYAFHLSESKKEVRAETLLQLIYDHGYTAAQKKVLQGFDASNAMYRLALKKSCVLKRDDEMLESALCLVDLKYEEANNAPQIVAMVANGEIDLALKRIESFSGADEEGVKRKFILYMLCLMELTLLGSKDKPFRKSSIEKLLNHLDEQLPTDDSILRWNVFFPSYLMFQMASEWAEMGLDCICVYKRRTLDMQTIDWENDWIWKKGPYSALQFETLLKCASVISDNSEKSAALESISAELAEQGKLKESFECARGISDDTEKSRVLSKIVVELSKQGQVEESLAIARGISDEYFKSRALKAIAVVLSKQGQVEESASVMLESLAIARGICDEIDKVRALKAIAIVLSKQGQVEESASVMLESLAIARGMSDERYKSIALMEIAEVLSKQGQVDESASVMQESLAIARVMSDERDKRRALSKIAVVLSKQGQVEESLAIARGMSFDWDNLNAFMEIVVELSKQGQVEELLAIARGMSDERDKFRALSKIVAELSKQKQVEESLAIAHDISNDWGKSNALMEIVVVLSKQRQVEESLAIARVISDEEVKSRALKAIAVELSKQGQVKESASVMQESLAIARGICDEIDKRTALMEIAVELSKQGQVEESLTIARGISDERDKSRALGKIVAELIEQGQMEESASVMLESLAIARGMSNERDKSRALSKIVAELSKQRQVEESLAIARVISDEEVKSSALMEIAVELSKQGQVKESASVMQESQAIARAICDIINQSCALQKIAIELSKQGLVEDSLAIARDISYDMVMHFTFMYIVIELCKQGLVDESLAIARGIIGEVKCDAFNAIAVELIKQGRVEESLAIARGISDEWNHYSNASALRSIVVELIKQGQVEESLAVILDISHEAVKIDALGKIAIELSKQGLLEDSLAIARGISDEDVKSRALIEIAVVLSKHGQVEESASMMQESLVLTRDIIDESDKNSTLMDIAVELSKQDYFANAESFGLEIPQIAKRQECWKEIAKSVKSDNSLQIALDKYSMLQSDEARVFYLKGLAESIILNDFDVMSPKDALPFFIGDSDSIEKILQTFSKYELFFSNPSQEKINRLNKTLNIQWAIDIRSKFPKEENNRNSENVKDWVDAIEDEDDRDQVLLWAKQVAKGKITEADFGEKIKAFI